MGRPRKAVMPIPQLPSILDTDAAPAPGSPRLVRPDLPRSQSALAVDPAADDLLARALAILAEETGRWRARQAANLSPG
ncbi:MAG: hypothetical protein ABI877_01005 [Gemmatimonadaceae bacterium]